MLKSEEKKTVAVTIADLKVAFATGKLSDYKPIITSGTGAVQSTCNASWGPAMRR